MEYFANAVSLGVVSNTAGTLFTNATAGNPFFLLWSNVPAGSYALSAVATDSAGFTATSFPVNISVLPHTNRPPEVRITSPPNAAVFRAPLNLPLYGFARDADGFVTSVEFFANGANSLGLGGPVPVTPRTNQPPSSYYTNYFFLVWSNAPAGQYALTAAATDNSNAVTVSLPVHISILPSTPPPTNYAPVVTVTALDPIAIEGTNCWVYPGTTNATGTWSNWVAGTGVPITNCGPKNATFSLYRCGDTNHSLTVSYALGGTASNGVDYVTLPGVATILAGQRRAFLSVVPIDDGAPNTNTTVILKLLPSTNTPPAYAVGSPASAAAVIIDVPPAVPVSAVLPDRTFHVSASGPNGAWFHVEYSTDFVRWTPLCTNQVVNGSIDFIDPAPSTSPARFYRAVPEAKPPQ